MDRRLEAEVPIIFPDTGLDSTEGQTWVYLVLWYYQHVFTRDMDNFEPIDEGRWVSQSTTPVEYALANANDHAGINLIMSEFPEYIPNADDLEIAMTLVWEGGE